MVVIFSRQAGWVHGMKLHKLDCSLGSERFLVMGKVISNCNINHYELSFFNKKKKVKHSQRMSATPLLPWIILEPNGEILASHCTCMAG